MLRELGVRLEGRSHSDLRIGNILDRIWAEEFLGGDERVVDLASGVQNLYGVAAAESGMISRPVKNCSDLIGLTAASAR